MSEFTSADGTLTLDARDLAGDRKRYLTKAGTKMLLDNQQLIDLLSTMSDDVEDDEWVNMVNAAQARVERGESVANVEDGNGDDNEGEDTTEDDDTTEEVSSVAITGDRKRAYDFVARLPGWFDAMFNEELDIKAKVKAGVLHVWTGLRTVFGDDGLNDFPVPDSVKFNKETGERSNNPDKYIGYVTVKGEKKEKKRSFYQDLSELSAPGKAAADMLAYLTSKKGEATLSATDLVAEKKAWTQRQSDCRSLFKRAMKFHFQYHAVLGMPLVHVRFTEMKRKVGTNEDGSDKFETVIRNTPTPIIVQEKGKPENFKAVSVSTFLSYDIAAAMAKGGSVEDLWATAGTGADNGEDDEDKLPDVNQAIDWLGLIAQQFEQKSFLALLYKKLNGKEADASLLSIGGVYEELAPLFGQGGKFEKPWKAAIARAEARQAKLKAAQKPAA